MTDAPAKTYADFILPPTVVTKVDVSRLVAELERVDTEIAAVVIRAKTGSQDRTMPILSEQLTDFLRQNQLKLDTGQSRAELIKQVRLMKDKVPVLHMTFAVPTDTASLQQLTQWVRTSIHPQAVIVTGLQPGLVAGVYLRTPNHVHDFSLRAALNGQHDALVTELESYRGAK